METCAQWLSLFAHKDLSVAHLILSVCATHNQNSTFSEIVFCINFFGEDVNQFYTCVENAHKCVLRWWEECVE